MQDRSLYGWNRDGEAEQEDMILSENPGRKWKESSSEDRGAARLRQMGTYTLFLSDVFYLILLLFAHQN